MPQPPPEELLGAVADALRGDRAKVWGILQGAQQQALERARSEGDRRAGGPAPAAAPLPRAVPPLAPDRPVEIRRQDGRRLRATIVPPLAGRRELAALGRVTAANDREAFQALQQQRGAIETLQRSHGELARRVAELEEQSGRALIRLLQGLEAQATASRIQQATAVVSSTQAAAFGQRGSVLLPNNLLLAGNQLLWSFLEPLLRGLGLSVGPSPGLAAWLAPLGSLLTGHMLLGNRQHVRFLSDVATFDGTARVVFVSLRERVADALWPEFQRRTDVPVTLVPVDPPGKTVFSADVREGLLRIRSNLPLEDPPPRGRVAWMVDLGADVG